MKRELEHIHVIDRPVAIPGCFDSGCGGNKSDCRAWCDAKDGARAHKGNGASYTRKARRRKTWRDLSILYFLRERVAALVEHALDILRTKHKHFTFTAVARRFVYLRFDTFVVHENSARSPSPASEEEATLTVALTLFGPLRAGDFGICSSSHVKTNSPESASLPRMRDFTFAISR